MATLVQRINDLATRVATEIKAVRTLVNGNTNDLSGLSTTNKSNLVAAMNELYTAIQQAAANNGATINDAATTSTTQTYSIDKIKSQIQSAVAAVVDSSPTALDTLKELATALGNDANFSTTVMTALGNRVRFDAAQTLTAAQMAQAKANIDAYGALEIGNPDTNFVTTFTTGLS